MTKNFKIRASSFGSLFDCAYKFEGIHLLGMRSPSSARAHLGTSIHHGTAVFDSAKIFNTDDEPVTAMDACNEFLRVIRHPEYDVAWRGADIGQTEAERIGLTLVNRYCQEVSPNYDFLAVEMTTVPLVIDCGNGVTVTLTGSLDRARIARRHGGGIGISDIKTGKTASKDGVAKTKGHKAQLGTYELLFEHSTGGEYPITEPAEIIGLSTGKTPDVGTGLVHNAKDLLLGDDRNPGYIKLASEIFRTGLFTPNPQSGLCSKNYCPRYMSCCYHD